MKRVSRLGVLGVGAMGGALLDGILRSGAVRATEVIAYDADAGRLADACARHRVTPAPSAAAAAEAACVLLCVKPYQIAGLVEEIAPSLGRDQLLISIAAGIRTTQIEAHLPAGVPVVRAMPNIAATVRVGATGLCAGSSARRKHLSAAERLLRGVGLTAIVDEGLMDAVTAVSGSGPAFVFLFIEAMADAGVRLGLPRATALALATQTVAGGAAMARDSGEHPGALKDKVTSPAGTTIEGIAALERCGLRHAVIEAVTAAGRRAQELGRS